MTRNTMSPGETVIEIVLAGVILTVLGSALAPLLPWNFALLGVLIVVAGLVFGMVMLGVVLSNLLNGAF